MPTLVYLDTNALLMPFQFGIRLEDELDRLLGAYQICIPEPVQQELDNLRGQFAKAARELAGRYPVHEAPGRGDDGIIEIAIQNNAVVVTNDSGLRARLKEKGMKVLFMRELSKLEWDMS